MFKRLCSILFLFTITFVSCEQGEVEYEYPDCIPKPNIVIESRGCGNIFVYQFIDSSKALTVTINTDKFNLTERRQEIVLGGTNPNLSVILEIAGNDPDSIYFNFCSDVAFPNMGITKKYKAVSGKLSFSVSEDNPIKDPIWKTFYYVTIMIENLHLVNQENSDEIVIDRLLFGMSVLAGCLANFLASDLIYTIL